jgi:hypothetical protein
MAALLALCSLSLASSRAGAAPTRRAFVAAAPLAAASLVLAPRVGRADGATAAAAATAYVDAASGAAFAYPSGWAFEKKTLDRGQLPLVIVTQAGAPSTNAFFSVNSIRGDYPTLGSFGSPADVLVNLVPPPGTPGVSSEVLAAQSTGKTYAFDYKIAFDGGATRHLRTVFAIAHAPSGSDYLVTLTAQSEEASYAAAKPDLDAIVASFRLAA